MDCSCAVNIKYLATEAEVEIEAPICPTPRNSVNSTRPAHTDADGEEGKRAHTIWKGDIWLEDPPQFSWRRIDDAIHPLT